MFGFLLLSLVAMAMIPLATRQANYHTVRATAAADITLPRAGLYLAQIRLLGAAVPSAFQYRYLGSAQATFVCPSDGTRGRRIYKMREQFKGTIIPAGAQTFTGAGLVVEMIFTDVQPSSGYTFEDLRGILLRRVDAGAVTANITGNYDVAPASPRAVEVYQSASAGRLTFPSIDQLTPQVEAVVAAFATEPTELIPAPPLSPSNSLTVSGITDGAATIQAVVYY